MRRTTLPALSSQFETVSEKWWHELVIFFGCFFSILSLTPYPFVHVLDSLFFVSFVGVVVCRVLLS
eukprot:m.272504 g.272504  ORF g.272504 m.272504 type:complete len:66 (+) comp58361_c0_seq1:492-689(+)